MNDELIPAQQRVIVAMSGGVDSSVTALLCLQLPRVVQQGFFLIQKACITRMGLVTIAAMLDVIYMTQQVLAEQHFYLT